MKKLIAAMLLLAAGSAKAEWFSAPNTTDVVLQSTFTGLILVDWMQTSAFTRDSKWMETHHESNLFLGPYPSQERVNAYQIGTIVVHAAISYALPNPWRNAWQMLSIGFELEPVISNFRLGISLRIPWN